MTEEEKKKAINALKISAPVMAVTQEEFNDYIKTLNTIMDWLEKTETVTEFADRCRECGKMRKGHWILQSSNKDQGERNFIWWKCSECGQVIYSGAENDRREYHAFCGRCGAKMEEV